MSDYVTAYWQAIEAGEVTVCKKTRTIYEHLAKEIEADTGRWAFSESKANAPIQFAERFCIQSKGPWAGKPMRLELWQKAFVSALFGFVDRETGEQRHTEAMLCVGRKGGKSTLAASLLLFLFVCTGQADCFVISTKLDQSMQIFEECLHMIEASPLLSKRIRKRRNDLYLAATKSKLQALGRASNTLDGKLAKGVVVDECHAMEGLNGRRLYENMRQSQSSTLSPTLLVTTTAGWVTNGIFTDLYELSAKILDGTITGEAAERFLPVIYELDDPEEWRDERCWFKANPSLEPQGKIKRLDFLRAEVARAEANPVDLPGILTKDFNIRSGSAQGAWLQLHEIENPATFDLKDCAGKWAIGGVDLSKVNDLTCATIVMHDEGDKWICHQCYWIPEDKLDQRIKRDKIPYDAWIRAGLVRTCKGSVIRTEDVTGWFLELVQEHDISIHSIWYDAWSATAWQAEMKELGFRMVPVHQGAKTLSLPIDHLEAALKNKQINYNASPILLWCLTNTGIQTDRNGNRVICKNLSPRHRIDGAASLLDSVVGIVNSPDFADLD